MDEMAHGGEAVGRAEGKAVFVAGALPGELVEVEVTEERGKWARAALISVVEPSRHRLDAPCSHFGACGGCQWQFATRATQATWKQQVVAGQLRHLGNVADPDVRSTRMPGPALGYRNRMDFRVSEGRPALYRRRSRELETLGECPLLAPPLVAMLDEMGDLSPLRGVTVRAGLNTGDRLAVLSGPLPDAAYDWSFPVCRMRRGRTEPIAGDPHLTEQIGDTVFRVTGNAFFQNNTAGAEALIEVVDEALEVSASDTLLDAYAGGGLFSLTVGRHAGRVVAVESAGATAGDLAFNSRHTQVEVVAAPVEQGLGHADWTVCVCDPPRTGLGASGVATVTRTQPRAVAYVSCDPASLARDARLFRAAGYDLDYAIPLDLFPQTFHIETMARFAPR